jgi:hypothetical protein
MSCTLSRKEEKEEEVSCGQLSNRTSLPNRLPLISEIFPDTELDDIFGAISWNCITYRHLKAARCQNIKARPWRPCPHHAGHEVRRILYTRPVHVDVVPRGVARLFHVPRTLQANIVQRLYCDGGELTLVEQAYTQDVAHLVQNVWHFRRIAGGGVDMRLWVDAIWKRDQPTTRLAARAFVKKSIAERRSRNDAIACRAEFWVIVQTAARKYRESLAADVERAPWRQTTWNCAGVP